MKASTLGLMASFAASAFAQKVLFLDGLQAREYDEAVALGYDVDLKTETEWAAMTSADFAAYNAIVIPDPVCGRDLSTLGFLDTSKSEWSPAVTGNIILIGTDPSFHFGQGKAKTLIDNSLAFAVAGKNPAGVPQTGLYFALSCFWHSVDSAKVDALSLIGDFTVRGNLGCYNDVHLVASSDAMDSLDDESLSGWSCSVHEAFAEYPSVGINGFQALAIAENIFGVGSQTFGDGTQGLPYIISRGATPAKCGDGVWDEAFGEECDDGNTLNGDGCSLSCKCESGLPKGDGTCFPSNTTTPGGPTGTGHSYPPTGYPTGTASSYPPYPTGGSSAYPPHTYPGPYGNSSATPTYGYPGGHSAPYSPPPYATPSCPTGPKIIGVEVVVEVTYSASSYVPYSTKERPIYDHSTSVLPCYICAISSEHITYTSTEFITVTTTSYPTSVSTYAPPVVYPCKTCAGHTFTETECIKEHETVYEEYPAIPYVTETPHVHVSMTEYEHDDHTYYSYYSVAAASTAYPVGSGGTTLKATATGTGYYYPTASAVAEFTGAAGVGKEIKAAGVVGAAVVAVAAML
ncbi:hypothetical protein BDV96DRAFT_601437 [Lophiotrema nucula]|uniref:Uncharacterized protein n=1 Tax=Lophiotrema nucula TaxID=690887 RepID=A0A6A5Z312_9PLEO|nr:hypothetical protein BDV96DRAFT_601437 [Lophiotrema nucula]